MCIVKAAQTIVSFIFNLGFGTETPAVFVFIVRSCEHTKTHKMNIVKPLFVIVFLSKGLAEPNNFHNHRADRRNNYFNSDEVFWNNIEWDSNPRLQNHNLVYSPRWNSPARRLPWRQALSFSKHGLK